MYKPHKQHAIQVELETIKSLVKFKNFVDKKDVQNILKCSEKTSERRLNMLGLNHMNNRFISCLIKYEEGVDTETLATILGCSTVNVNALARRHSIKRPIGFMNTLKSDFEFFDNIDTEYKAYILGFFAADGCITDTEFKIAISNKDVDILNKIKYQMNSEVEIKHRIQNTSFSSSKISIFNISSTYLVNSLKTLGFTKKKTIECQFPSIPEEMYLHFIRGYFDGDGTFNTYTTKGYTKFFASLCGTESFLLFVKNYLESTYDCKFNSKLTKRFDTENCCYALNMSGGNNVIHLLNLLYKDSSIYLDRKYNRYLDLIK